MKRGFSALLFLGLLAMWSLNGYCFQYPDLYPYRDLCPNTGILYGQCKDLNKDGIPDNFPCESWSNSDGGFWANGKTGFAQCNCTDYAAEMMWAYGVDFSNKYYSPRWGNGGQWNDAATAAKIIVDQNPMPGDIAYWEIDWTGDPERHGDDYGHVAVVERVNFDASGKAESINITEYNNPVSHEFNSRTISVNDPSGFIHILAYEEGNGNLYYTDCYEMQCPEQTPEQWKEFARRAWSDYRCKDCKSDYDQAFVDEMINFFGGMGGGGDDPSSGKGGDANVKVVKASLEGKEDWQREMVVAPGTKIDLLVEAEEKEGKNKVDDARLKYYVTYADQKVFDENPNRYLADDDGVDIDPGQRITEHKRSISVPSDPGTYYYYLKISYDKDSNPENNVSNVGDAEEYAKVTVVPNDLKGVSCSFSPTSNILPGSQLRFQTWWSNPGADIPRDIRVAYFVSGNLVGTGTIKKENFKRGATKYEDFYFVAPSPGNWTLSAVLDPDNFVAGDDKSNNTLSVPFQVQNLPPPPMMIWILNPTPGETWKSDAEHYIKWRTQSLGSSEHFVIDFSLNNGASWTRIDGYAGNDGSKRWKMRDFSNIKSDTTSARIRIISVEHPWVSAVSQPFRIDYKKKK